MRIRCLPRLFGLLSAAVLLPAGAAYAQSGLTANGTINTTLIHKSGISVVFNTNASGIALGGSGSYAVTMDFGNISRYGALTTGVSRTSTASDFTVSTPIDVYVDKGGTTSSSYNMTASLSTAPGVYAFTFDAVTLSTTAVTVVTNDANYNTNRTHAIYLTVPLSAAPGAVSNTINVTVTAN